MEGEKIGPKKRKDSAAAKAFFGSKTASIREAESPTGHQIKATVK